MKRYCAKKVTGTPDWEDCPSAFLEEKYRLTPAETGAEAQLAWTDDKLLVHLRAYVSDIRAEEKGPTGSPCEDSCLEFFFCPVPGDGRYFNIEFNFNGCVYLGFASGLSNLVRLLPEGGCEQIFHPEIKRTPDGWEIFYEIPFDFIRRFLPEARPAAGNVIKANFYACSDLSNPPYYISWSPVRSERFTFHNTDNFGEVVFENN